MRSQLTYLKSSTSPLAIAAIHPVRFHLFAGDFCVRCASQRQKRHLQICHGTDEILSPITSMRYDDRTIYVDPEGDNANNGLTRETAVKTVQEAVNRFSH